MSRCSCLFWGKEWLLYASVTSFIINPIISPLLLLLHPASNSRYNGLDSSDFALVFFTKYQKGALYTHSRSLLMLFGWCSLGCAAGWKLIISFMSVCSTSFLLQSYCLASLFLQLCLWGSGQSETAWCVMLSSGKKTSSCHNSWFLEKEKWGLCAERWLFLLHL